MEMSDSQISIAVRGSTLSGLARRVVEQELMDAAAAQQLMRHAEEDNKTFLSAALDSGSIDRSALYRCASEEFGIPLLDLDSVNLEYSPDELVDSKFVEDHGVIPLFQRGSKVFVAIDDPADSSGLDALKFHTGLGVEPVLVDTAVLKKSIEDADTDGGAALADLAGDENLEDIDISGADDEAKEGDVIEEHIDTPIVRFVNKLFLDAIKQGASDIHVEPYEKKVRVRYRIDGVLHEVASPPVNLAGRIAARIKILSHLNIAERRVPQDGRMKLHLSKSHSIDFRVSSLPTLFGEKIVIRVLDTSGLSLSLDALGFEPEQLELYMEAIKRPYGMILVTGPTGSGKTVSLYSALNILNTPEVNISSAEDPVEINLMGINQVNVNEKAGLTFASALRSFLRQDPDIVMVGEIRDLETGEIAVKASQTGHLVLSTLHTNDATATIVRLLNMGIEPFNVGSSVHLIMAQRLARKLCDNCKKAVEYPHDALIKAGYSEEEISGENQFHEAVGCNVCTSGYKGRTGIFEVMPVSEDMSNLIIQNKSQVEIENQARKEGINTLRKSGLIKAQRGITSLEEVLRVTND